jgi:hypothetical protein
VEHLLDGFGLLPLAFGVFLGLVSTNRSRAGMAEPSRAMWPTKRLAWVARMSASWAAVDNWELANSAKAREKVDS